MFPDIVFLVNLAIDDVFTDHISNIITIHKDGSRSCAIPRNHNFFILTYTVVVRFP